MLFKVKKLTALLLTVMTISLSFISAFAQVSCIITHQPTVAEPYISVTNEYSASYQWFECKTDGGKKSVDGQTSNRLTVTPDGKKYFCRISWSDGTEKLSDVITNNYTITHQPSAEEPFVALNNHSEANFQWYQNNHKELTIVIDDPDENEIAVSYFWSGTCSDGEWSGNSAESVDIEFVLEKNQILTVTPNEDFSGTVEEYGESFLPEHSGVYTYTSENTKDFNLCIEDSKPFTAEIKIITFTSASPVYGQTESSLNADADGNYYFCKISGNGGMELSSLIFRSDLVITHQPTAKEPYVEINTSENTSYSWYEVVEKTYKITDDSSSAGHQISDLWVGSFSAGKWHSNQSGTFEAVINIHKGQTVIIDLPDNFSGGIGGLKNENGAYLYTAATNEKFYLYLKNSEPYDFDIYIKEFENKEQAPVSDKNTLNIPVNGKYYRCEVSIDEAVIVSEIFKNTYAITHQPTENEPFVETNSEKSSYQWYRVTKKLYTVVDKITAENELNAEHIYIGTYADSLWSSDNGKIDIELDLKKDDVLIINPSDGFEGTVSEYKGNTLSLFENSHTFVAQKDGLFDLYAFSKSTSDEFSASIKVLRGAKDTVLDGQNIPTLSPVSGGEYICVVNFADGTVIDSDTVDISKGTLDKLETELEKFSENNVNEDNLPDITNIVKTANELKPSDTAELGRINSVIEKASVLIGIINEKTNLVNSLSSAVGSYDINKIIPSDKAAMTKLKANIIELQNSGNLSTNQKNKLSELLEKCNSLITKAETMNLSVSIVNNPSVTEIRYGETIVLSAVATDMPHGAKFVWYVNNSKISEGEKFSFSPETNSSVTLKITDENGNVICDKSEKEISDSEQINVRSNIFIKIINFFKKLFGINQTIVQTVK